MYILDKRSTKLWSLGEWLTMGTLFAVVSSSVMEVRRVALITMGTPFSDIPPSK
jgi:hypothetical protein